MVTTRNHKQKCLVTGGAGFLGKHLVSQLLDSGQYEVTVFDIRETDDTRVNSVTGDLREAQQVDAACKGMDVVFHCATAAPSAHNATGNEGLMYAVNVKGTENIVAACVKHSVPKLVYTSSASVVFEGKDLLDVDERAPYARKPMDYYTHTKVLGEKIVVVANGRGGLATVALRPSGLFGPGDPLFLPVLVAKAREGKLKYILGNGKNFMDWTYISNVAQAHIQAAEALSLNSPVAGQAYFITNDEPVLFWDFMGDMLEGLGYGRPYIRLPYALLITLAFIFESCIKPLFALAGRPLQASEFTANRIAVAASHRRFRITRAKKELGYIPQVSLEDGKRRTLDAFQHLRADDGKSKSS